MHSLNSFKQEKFAFLSVPGKLTQFMAPDLVAVVLYNASSARFDEEWTRVLRAIEIQDCPAIVIAEEKDIERVKSKRPEEYRMVHFIEKPVRIPELIRALEGIASQPANDWSPGSRRFSLAEAALRNRRVARN